MTDKLRPVRCGCGGKAVAIGDADNNIYFVKCDKCWISTDLFHSKAEAVEAWNRAMGAGKSEIAITKGYWMTTYDGLHCSVCNYKCETTALPEVCPHCGTRLIRW